MSDTTPAEALALADEIGSLYGRRSDLSWALAASAALRSLADQVERLNGQLKECVRWRDGYANAANMHEAQGKYEVQLLDRAEARIAQLEALLREALPYVARCAYIDVNEADSPRGIEYSRDLMRAAAAGNALCARITAALENANASPARTPE